MKIAVISHKEWRHVIHGAGVTLWQFLALQSKMMVMGMICSVRRSAVYSRKQH